jgi:hypothetical protein
MRGPFCAAARFRVIRPAPLKRAYARIPSVYCAIDDIARGAADKHRAALDKRAAGHRNET